MSNSQQIEIASSWITPEDLHIAYRKAKADLYYADQLSRDRLLEYEQDLENRLDLLGRRLRRGEALEIDEDSWSLAPKSLNFPKDLPPSGNLVSSDPWKVWERKCRQVPEGKRPTAEFRLIEMLPIDFHIVSALWINKVGDKFDACLSENSYGNRLRRKQNDTLNPLSLGSFKHYFKPYREWRDKGFEAMKQALESGKKVVSISADATAYFHELTPDFILDKRFQRRLDPSFSLTKEEADFTAYFVAMLQDWAESTPLGKGLPVGLSASSLIGNLALLEFDQLIEQEVVPLYYGRYVDDIILVLENTNDFQDDHSVWRWITVRCHGVLLEDSESESSTSIRYAPSYLSTPANIRFDNEKNKIFLLEGDTGKAWAQAFIQHINERASEWRSLPEIPSSPDRVSAELLSAVQQNGDPADSLRKAEGLSLKRASLAIILRDYEAYERALRPTAWKNQRQAFFKAINSHLLVPESFFDLAKYVPRILQLALTCGDLDSLKDLLEGIERVCISVQESCEFKLKAYDTAQAGIDELELDFVEEWFVRVQEEVKESIFCAFNRGIDETAWSELEDEKWEFLVIPDYSECKEHHIELFERDLARTPFRTVLYKKPLSLASKEWIRKSKIPSAKSSTKRLPQAIRASARKLSKDLGSVPIRNSAYAFLYPTRPVSLNEVYLLFDNPFSNDADTISDVILGQRGFSPETQLPRFDEDSRQLKIDCGKSTSQLRIAIASWKTKPESWKASVLNEEDPDRARFTRLNRLVNQAIRLPKAPNYLVFPELSIPAKWFLPLATKLQAKGISLICGIEYLHTDKNKVANQVWAALPHDALGFPSLLIYRQDKQRPAQHEEAELFSIANKEFVTAGEEWENGTPPVLVHRGFHFAILVCSELTNISYRAELRGEIDALFVPEWNRDTESFNALVESAALDIHAYVIQCNDRQYGDSRIRVPHKNSWMRDPVRIKGGKHDYLVVGEIDIKSLRDFQSQHRSPSKPFKPVPDGFSLSGTRKAILGSNSKEASGNEG